MPLKPKPKKVPRKVERYLGTLITTEQAAEEAGITRQGLSYYINRNAFGTARKFGTGNRSFILISRDEFDPWLKWYLAKDG